MVKQKASFFVNFGRAETDDNELIRATVLDDNLNIVDLGTAFLTPKRNTFFSPRFDYAINNNTRWSRVTTSIVSRSRTRASADFHCRNAASTQL